MKQAINTSTGVASLDLKNHLRTAYNVVAVPRLTVDWNMNRYATPTVKNTPSEDTDGYDIENFPIETLADPLRPTKGIAKAIVNQSIVSSGYLSPKSAKFYVSDPEDVYKYWVSPYATDGSGNFSSPVMPEVNYDRAIKVNKIVIKVENTWASPKNHQVLVNASVGGAYVAVGPASPAIASDGTITLYFGASGWTSTRPTELLSTTIGGVRFQVGGLQTGADRNGNILRYTRRTTGSTLYTTNGANSRLSLIAIEPHYEEDLSERIISVEDTFDLGEASDIYPIGTITSNVGSISLANEDGVFNPENTNSPYYRLIEPNCEFNLEYIYTVGNQTYRVQQFKMYASEWSNDEDGVANVSLEDYSKYLKEINPRAMLINERPSTEIIWRVLDSVGFVNYDFSSEDLQSEHIIPIFWTTGDETVWEVLDQIAKGTQTAIYFDCYGKLQCRTRSAAYRAGDAIDWTILGVDRGSELADILSWSPKDELESNKVKVTYKGSKWKVNSRNKYAMSNVWSPSGDSLVVRANPLVRTITNGSTHIFIEAKDAKLWPYKSKVLIDGEIIQYEGKQFVYYLNGSATTVNVKSEEEYRKFNKKTPAGQRGQNHFTGGLRIINRGIWNTTQVDHSVDIANYTVTNNVSGSSSGLTHNKANSQLVITTPSNMSNTGHLLWAARSSGTGYKMYGTRFKFDTDKSFGTQKVGLAMNLDNANSGIYVEVSLSRTLTDAERKHKGEIAMFNDTVKLKDVEETIAPGIWYDLDVYFTNAAILVYLNGRLIISHSPGLIPSRGKFALTARGKTKAFFEYLYAANTQKDVTDSFDFNDLKNGGVRGNTWLREVVWELKSRPGKNKKKNSTKNKIRKNQYLFDEFGPIVHEIREFDVKFDPNPVRFSYPFLTNISDASVIEYTGSPFGAKFVVANTARQHAVIAGTDSATFAPFGKELEQQFLILGNNVEIADEETVERKNEPSIRARGEIVSEITNQWIQSKDMAESLADWIASHWSDRVDEVEVEIFGNPLIELGDNIDVEYPLENAFPATHKYFVVGTKTNFDEGMTTTIKLRRNRPATNIS